MKSAEILVLTNERDFAADDVIRRLGELGANVRRLNIEAARTFPVDRWDLAGESTPPRVIWWRQFEVDAHPADLEAVDDTLVERAQWRSWLAAIHRPNTTWVNDLWSARRAENKLVQLEAAKQVGFSVPPTIVTNDPSDAREFSAGVGPCVVKTLSAGYFAFSDQSFVFTETLEDALRVEGARWHAAPLVVQQRLAGLDGRVICVGDSTFAAKCRTEGTDWRKTPFDAALWQPWSAPDILIDSCRSYCRRLGLRYAAFDFMVTGEGNFFLEANQAGEWMFLDRNLHMGISAEIAAYLAELAQTGVRVE